MKHTSFSTADKIYCYELSTGTIIKSNGKFSWIDGKPEFTHSGKVNEQWVEAISFKSEDVILSYEIN